MSGWYLQRANVVILLDLTINNKEGYQMKIRKSLLVMEKESYADDNATIPADAVDCTQGCNPYGNHPSLIEVAKNAVVDSIYNYPHGQEIYEELEKFWSRFAPVKRENIFLADGSMGALYEVNNVFEEPEAKALSIAPTFTDATNIYKTRGMEYRYVALKPENNYKFCVDDVLAEMDAEDSILYVDNPNNPTGQVISLEDIEKMVAKGKELDIAVIIDEAYGDFIPPEESAACLLGKYDNLIMVRTFSKAFGMAGMRAGYVIADELIIKNINKMSNPYCMNEFARQMAAAAFRNADFALSHMDDFVKSNQMLRAVTGKNLIMSESDDRVPICMLTHKDPDVKLANVLAEAGVIAVDASEFDTIGQNAVRLRVPSIDKMEKVCASVAKVNEG